MRTKVFLEENYEMLLRIFNCMKVGIWITDGEGRVVMVNDESLKEGGLEREKLMGKKMTELIEMGYILYESSVLKAMDSGKTESIIQELGVGGALLAVSVPLPSLEESGKFDLIICTERTATEVVELKELLSEQKDIAEKYRQELARLKSQKQVKTADMVAQNLQMIRLRESAARIGGLDATVIITGESGTGKEILVDVIYQNSKRVGKPFIKVNCAAIPENLMESEFFGYEKGTFTGANQGGKLGIFELADGGTLFLDEIGELPLPIQSKLLRVLQEREVRRIGGDKAIPVDIRLIAATNRNLKEEIKKGNFRSDLYYRLFIVPLNVPPLRERKEDIRPLAHHFIAHFNSQYGLAKTIGEDALELMEQYAWPGNVRELRNVIERLTVSGAGNYISAFQLRICLNEKANLFTGIVGDNGEPLSLEEMVSEYEKQILRQVMEECDTLTEAAKQLKVNKSTISRKLKKYQL